MSTHSYSRCWLHLIWETLRREPMLDKRAAAQASANLSEYSYEKGIYMSRVANYIARQEEHHRKKSFTEEYELFVKRYGLEWRDEENRLKRFGESQRACVHPVETG
jgi:hypothetical protein